MQHVNNFLEQNKMQIPSRKSIMTVPILMMVFHQLNIN